MSLAELSDWCEGRFGKHVAQSDPNSRPYDIPWLVLDHHLAGLTWNWKPRTKLKHILEEIASHGEANPNWLAISAAAQ